MRCFTSISSKVMFVLLAAGTFLIGPMSISDAQADYSYKHYYDSNGNHDNGHWNSDHNEGFGRVNSNYWLNRNNWDDQNDWLNTRYQALQYGYNNPYYDNGNYYGNYDGNYYVSGAYSMWRNNYYGGDCRYIWANSNYPMMRLYNTGAINNWYNNSYGYPIADYNNMYANGVAIVDQDNPGRSIIIINNDNYLGGGYGVNRASIGVSDYTFNQLAAILDSLRYQANFGLDYGNHSLMYNNGYGAVYAPVVASVM